MSDMQANRLFDLHFHGKGTLLAWNSFPGVY
jgi:hypothetical protein